jgi:hypothetical protein
MIATVVSPVSEHWAVIRLKTRRLLALCKRLRLVSLSLMFHLSAASSLRMAPTLCKVRSTQLSSESRTVLQSVQTAYNAESCIGMGLDI